MKPLVIYHDHCTDGFAAAFCAWQKFRDEAEYVPLNYGKDQEKFQKTGNWKNRDVYVLDFSFNRELTGLLMEETESFTWLDHHKTAFEMWCGEELRRSEYRSSDGRIHILLDNSKSGAILTWEHFNHGQDAPEFIRFVDDRDRWQFKFWQSKPFHAAMSVRKPWTFEQWSELFGNESYPVGEPHVVAEGEIILEAYNQQVESLSKYARKCVINGETGAMVNSPLHMSEIGHVLATETGTFGLVWYIGEGNMVKCSLRSNGDYDVSAIAKQFGGGGHKNAAGFSTDVQTLVEMMK